jgi:hypothetical protein
MFDLAWIVVVLYFIRSHVGISSMFCSLQHPVVLAAFIRVSTEDYVLTVTAWLPETIVTAGIIQGFVMLQLPGRVIAPKSKSRARPGRTPRHTTLGRPQSLAAYICT